jgi:hypothetical protein
VKRIAIVGFSDAGTSLSRRLAVARFSPPFSRAACTLACRAGSWRWQSPEGRRIWDRHADPSLLGVIYTIVRQRHETMQDEDEALSVNETAARLGVSPDAVRKRIRRGSLPAHKRDGVWYVRLVNVSETRQADRGLVVQDTARDAALAFLERERDQLLRENDRLLALVEDQQATIAELARKVGAPTEGTEAEVRALREQIGAALGGGYTPPAGQQPIEPTETRQMPATAPVRRSWWQRLLGR